MSPPISHLATTGMLHIRWSLDLLWCLDVAPKAFGVGAFAMVALRKEWP